MSKTFLCHACMKWRDNDGPCPFCQGCKSQAVQNAHDENGVNAVPPGYTTYGGMLYDHEAIPDPTSPRFDTPEKYKAWWLKCEKDATEFKRGIWEIVFGDYTGANAHHAMDMREMLKRLTLLEERQAPMTRFDSGRVDTLVRRVDDLCGKVNDALNYAETANKRGDALDLACGKQLREMMAEWKKDLRENDERISATREAHSLLARRVDALTARVFDVEVPRAAAKVEAIFDKTPIANEGKRCPHGACDGRACPTCRGDDDPCAHGRRARSCAECFDARTAHWRGCTECHDGPAEIDWRAHDPAQARKVCANCARKLVARSKRYARLPSLAWHAARVAALSGVAVLGAIYVHGGGDAIMALFGR